MKFLKLFPLIAALFSAQVIAAPPVIFSGNDAKLLKKSLDFNGESKIISGSIDPTSVAVDAPTGSLYLSSNGNVYKKTDSGLSTNWTSLGSGGGGASWGSITGTLSDQTDLQSALDAIEGLATDAQDDIDAHIADSAGAHAGTAISNAPAGGISATTIQAAIDELDAEKQPLDAELTAVAGLSSNGLIARTGAGTAAVRTVTGTANQITVTNGDGVSGNPTISIPSNPTLPGGAVTLGTSGPSIQSGTVDPTITATSGEIGSLYLNTSTGNMYQKTDSGSSTNWRTIGVSAAVTGFTAYTPSFSGVGTPTNVSFAYRQIGSSIEIYGVFTTGSTSPTEIRVSLPDSLTVSSTFPTLGIVGDAVHGLAGSTYFRTAVLAESGSSYFVFGNQTSSVAATSKILGGGFGSSTPTFVRATIPVDGLASVVNTAQAAIVTGQTAFTPTGSWTSNTTYGGFYTRVGNEVEFDVTVSTSGTPTSATLTINLPNNWAIDTSNLSSAVAGLTALPSSGVVFDGGSRSGSLVALYNNTTSITVASVDSSTATPVVTQAAPIAFGSGDGLNIRFRVPIAGFGGTIPAPSILNEFSWKISSAGVVSNELSNYGGDPVSGNCALTDTSLYTCTLTPSFCSAAPNCSVTPVSTTDGREAHFEAEPTSSSVVVRTDSGGGTKVAMATNVRCQCPR